MFKSSHSAPRPRHTLRGQRSPLTGSVGSSTASVVADRMSQQLKKRLGGREKSDTNLMSAVHNEIGWTGLGLIALCLLAVCYIAYWSITSSGNAASLVNSDKSQGHIHADEVNENMMDVDPERWPQREEGKVGGAPPLRREKKRENVRESDVYDSRRKEKDLGSRRRKRRESLDELDSDAVLSVDSILRRRKEKDMSSRRRKRDSKERLRESGDLSDASLKRRSSRDRESSDSYRDLKRYAQLKRDDPERKRLEADIRQGFEDRQGEDRRQKQEDYERVKAHKDKYYNDRRHARERIREVLDEEQDEDLDEQVDAELEELDADEAVDGGGVDPIEERELVRDLLREEEEIIQREREELEEDDEGLDEGFADVM